MGRNQNSATYIEFCINRNRLNGGQSVYLCMKYILFLFCNIFPTFISVQEPGEKRLGPTTKFFGKNKINSEGIHITARSLNLSPDFRYRKMVLWLSSLIPHLSILCTNNILLIEMAYHLTIWFKTCLCNFIYRHFFMVGF